jgi:hypothetical protein
MMRVVASLIGGVAIPATLVACISSGPSAGSATDSGTEGATGLPACTWPASLDPTDASNGQCVAARALLSCPLAGGVTEGCLSNDLTQCPSGGPQAGAPSGACQDECQANEYALSCGTIGPGNQDAEPPPPPPAACRGAGVTPAGIYYECCPCGS